MITTEHVKIFRFFGGDIDNWARMKKPNDTMTNDIWFKIEDILQNLTLIRNGVASHDYTTQALHSMKSLCESPEVEQKLIELSKNGI